MTQPTKPKPQVTLRPALPKDAPQIAALGSSVFSTSFGYSMPAADLQAYLESAYSIPSLSRDLSNPSVTTIVACPTSAPDTVIGFAQLTRGTSEPCLEGCEQPVELQRLYVSPDFHGGGVGGMLVEEIEKVAREEGFVTLWLGVWEENFRAQRVYERMGFKKVGSHDFVMGSCVQTDWILTKRL
ncbi:acyl-CoA N-acyltransferase [Hyaloscypha bicolor E]|uniref:Acyl-CoA N-acyltransferase n=1 Tax=Hyaloscypha bicolor E TaxID=1095630 RepID=A0A2J6TEA1_9HELO|nr:acyl-CoA N-acyltransferase [Hyaloscypha bicolor E]PMD61364.1 acyl-CoA N-acyltransferase [Hyaloscypha bicolor E]